MARLLTAGGETGKVSQCDYCDAPDTGTNWQYGVTDTLPVEVPSPGSGSLWGYECAVTNLTVFKHAGATELFYRIRFFIAETTIGETIRFVHITDGSGLERYHTGNQNADIGLTILSDGTLRATREQSWATTLADSAAGTVLAQTWHLLQVRLKVANSGGILTVKLDGTTVIDFSGDTLSTINVSSGNETILAVQGSGNRTLIFDDIAVNDTSGSFNNSYPANKGVIGIIPNGMGTGTNNLDGTAQATNRHLNIDEVPASDADYNHDSTSGQYDLYTLEDPDVGDVGAVEIWERTFYPATASTFKFVHKYSGTEYRSAALAPTAFVTYPPPAGVDGPWYRHIPLDTIPGGSSPWTLEAFADLEAGFEVATSQAMRLLQLVVEVEAGIACFLEQTDGLLLINAEDASKSVRLDRATQKVGQVFYIKRIDGSGNTVTLNPVDTTIDRESSMELGPRDGIILIYSGSEWWTI